LTFRFSSRGCSPIQAPVTDETEQFEPVWVSRRRAGTSLGTGTFFFMIFPTIRTLGV
jgi:hypothetical protein